MNADQIAAIIPTRGDVDLTEILETLPFSEVIIWDNSQREDLKVYGRYAAIAETTKPFIYVQDDDAICPAAELAEAYDGVGLQVNAPEDEQPWLSWGALFPAQLPSQCFCEYLIQHPKDRFFLRWCDVAFAHLAGWTKVDLGHTELPWFNAPNRMHMEPVHYVEQQEMRDRIAAMKERRAVAA